MILRTCLAGIAGVTLLYCLATVPAVAAEATAPAPSRPHLPYRAPARAATAMTCPAVPAGVETTDATQPYFKTITQACLLRTSGQIDDAQFTMIRDVAVQGILYEVQARLNKSMNTIAANP